MQYLKRCAVGTLGYGSRRPMPGPGCTHSHKHVTCSIADILTEHVYIVFSYLMLNNIVTLKSRLEVIQTGIIRKLGCGFLFAFHSNYGRIFNRLRDIQHQSIWSIERHHFQWLWTNPTPSFKVTPFFDAEYLINGTTCRHIFNEVLIETYTRLLNSVISNDLKWPWVT